MSPERKLVEIEAAVRSQQARKKIIEDQAREAQRNTDLKIAELERQRAFVAQCVNDAERARNKLIAYRLEAIGIPAIDLVEATTDQAALSGRLQSMLEKAEAGAAGPIPIDTQESGHNEPIISEEQIKGFFV